MTVQSKCREGGIPINGPPLSSHILWPIRDLPRTDPASCQPDASVPAPVDCWLVAVELLVAVAGVVVVSVVACGWEGSVTMELYNG